MSSEHLPTEVHLLNVPHTFIFAPQNWLGEGKIRLTNVGEELAFSTSWSSSDKDPDGRISCLQEIQVKGVPEVMHNSFAFFDLGPHEFAVELENPSLGRVVGKGVFDERIIAWEFRVPEIDFEGFEFYERDQDGYFLRAEYATHDAFRTVITGKIWQRAPS